MKITGDIAKDALLKHLEAKKKKLQDQIYELKVEINGLEAQISVVHTIE